MTYENFGICTVKSSAFYRPLDKALPLPEDYVGDFAEPSRASDCCVVMRAPGAQQRGRAGAAHAAGCGTRRRPRRPCCAASLTGRMRRMHGPFSPVSA